MTETDRQFMLRDAKRAEIETEQEQLRTQIAELQEQIANLKRRQKLIEPLPCPWCGKIAEVTPISAGPSKKAYYVRCATRDCTVQPLLGADYKTRYGAVRAWNRRKA